MKDITKKETLYLIDGSNYIYRAYYAIGPLSTSNGFPTNALYGFTQMILKFIREQSPRYMAVVFDTVEPTFRDEIYEEYKANRKAPPDDLVEQFPYFKPILEALCVPVMEMPGFEADDIIGTIAKKFASSEMDVVIVSGDKDMMQLIGDDISIYDSMKDVRIGTEKVVERFGVGVSQVVDVLGLSGDASDNIPGVAGIGPKTASRLISQYGSIENLLKHLDELSEGVAKKIKADTDKALLSKKLATIDTNVPATFDLKDFLLSAPDNLKLREIFGKFEFSKLLSMLTPQTEVAQDNYKTIDSEKELKTLIGEIKKTGCLSLAVDPEMKGIAVACVKDGAVYLTVNKKSVDEKSTLFDYMDDDTAKRDLVDALGLLRPILEDSKIKKIGHDLKFSTTLLKQHGISIEGLYFDTMLASYLLNPSGDHDLDNDNVCNAANTAIGEYETLLSRLKESDLEKLFFELEMPLISALADMELAGIKVDINALRKLSDDFEKKLADIQKNIYSQAGGEFNINSPRQLGMILFEKLRLGTPKKTKTGYSTDIGVMEELAQNHPLPAMIIEYRSLSKLKSTYIDALLEFAKTGDGRVHTSFNQAVTATGRLSSSDPNLQNIPVRTEEGRQIREAFIAEKGFVLISGDYSQIELRVLAHMSRDKTLIDAFARGLDIHRMTAAGIFGVPSDKVSDIQRSVGKTINFATIYGQGPFSLSQQLGISPDNAKLYIDAYFKRYPRVEEYRKEVLAKALETGFVRTLFGRKRFVADLASKNAAVKQATERMAFNTVTQGTAADIIKLAMVELHHEMPKKFPNARMLVQVHDELLFEVPEKDAEQFSIFAKEIMGHAAKLDVPLVVDMGIGKNWKEVN